jgi:hypothetical protein
MDNFMELSPTSEAVSCTAAQELHNISWNPKVEVTRSEEPSTILSQINPVPTTSSYLKSTRLRLGLPSSLLPCAFATNILYAFFLALIRATCPINLVLLHLIFLITLGGEYKL